MNNFEKEFEQEWEKFLAVIDAKIDSIKQNLDECQKLAGDAIDSIKQFQSGLLPDSELIKNTFTGDPHQPSGEDLKAANEELAFDDRQDKKLEEDLGYGLEDEPSGHIEDPEARKEELRREREENL